MSARIVMLLLVTALISALLVIILYALSTDIRQQPGSFLRNYPPHPVIIRAQATLPDDQHYIAGVTENMLYLAHRVRPLNITAFNSSLTDTANIRLSLNAPQRLKYNHITVMVDSPYFHFIDGSIPYYYRGSMRTWHASNILPDNISFGDAAPMPSGSFGMRTVSARTGQSVLGKKTLTDSSARLKYNLLESQGVDHFSTDGDLQFNHKLNRFIYVYYYRNEYFATDTSLNLVYRAHTIDTFSRAQVKADTIKSKNRLALSAPPVVINRQFATHGNYLFVHSLVPARNEHMKRFNDVAVIDVYDLTQQQYKLSFQLGKPNGETLSGLALTGTKLYALFSRTLTVYDLNGTLHQQLP